MKPNYISKPLFLEITQYGLYVIIKYKNYYIMRSFELHLCKLGKTKFHVGQLEFL